MDAEASAGYGAATDNESGGKLGGTISACCRCAICPDPPIVQGIGGQSTQIDGDGSSGGGGICPGGSGVCFVVNGIIIGHAHRRPAKRCTGRGDGRGV